MSLQSSDYTPPATVNDLLLRYASGERRFPDCELSDANLTGVALKGAEFDGSWFSCTIFDGADLRDVSFRKCNVKCASFLRADLRGASFQQSAVEAAEFDEAQLEGASFEGAGYYGYTIHDGDGFPHRK